MQEIYNAIVDPLRSTNAWYGVFMAMAFRKQIRRFVEGAIGYAKRGGQFAKKKVAGGDNSNNANNGGNQSQ